MYKKLLDLRIRNFWLVYEKFLEPKAEDTRREQKVINGGTRSFSN